MADVVQLAREHRAALLANERAAASRMIAAYTDVYGTIKEQQDKLLAQMQAERDAGREPSIAWLRRQGRLDALMATAEGGST